MKPLIMNEKLRLRTLNRDNDLIPQASGNGVDWVTFSNKEARDLFMDAHQRFWAFDNRVRADR